MKLIFKINYRTAWGERLYVVGNIAALGNGERSKALPLSYVGDGMWMASVSLVRMKAEICYSYFVVSDKGGIRAEWGNPHRFRKVKDAECVELRDSWQERPADKYYYSTMFSSVVFRRENRAKDVMPISRYALVRVSAPSVKPNEDLLIVGNCQMLGNWDVSKALKMSDFNYPEWRALIPLNAMKCVVEYKFVKRNRETGQEYWDNCDNRILDVSVPEEQKHAIIVSGLNFCDSERPWRGAGTAIPVFSIRTEDDFGVGDFLSIKKMVDWLSETGQCVLQLLPVNDTTLTRTWMDSYPYNANSTFALHPMYLNLKAIGELKDINRRRYYDRIADELNSLPQVDYERVNAEKSHYAREIYDEIGGTVTRTNEFRQFVKENIYWLKNYAVFCFLRDEFGTADFSNWGENAVFNQAQIDALCEANPKEIEFVYFVQFYLHKQLREARDYAHAHGVALKGDIPIGISRTSVDAWTNPELFNMDFQAGAPPDDFSKEGQNWGFPTYNWERMASDGFLWWKNRMRKMSEYFDLYRIDHILGFFRIWQVPISEIHGLLGRFYPALPLSVEELSKRYGFHLQPEEHLSPYITDDTVEELFGDYAEVAKSRFLRPIGNQRYALKDSVDTQRKVEMYFAGKSASSQNRIMETALYRLIDNVLFVEDSVEKGKYHPRIAAQSTSAYAALPEAEQAAFNAAYNDFYYHRHNEYWFEEAMKKLPELVESTDMLACGEDLGMIPDCVPMAMRELQILSLEIQRMPKILGIEFGEPLRYPYLSVCTTSTHDMCGIRQWWEENHERSQRFFRIMLEQQGEAPSNAEPWICDSIVDRHLKSPAMLAILPWQDWISIDGELRHSNPCDEQINEPSNPRHYWRYRMHLTVEKLLRSAVFNSNLRNKVRNAGRG